MVSKPNVVNFFDRRRKKPPELRLDVPVAATPADTPEPAAYIIPPGKPKLLMAIGSGQTGKSTLLRWVAERAATREGTVLGTLAPNRTLKRYFPETVTLDSNSTSGGAQFVETFVELVIERQTNAVLDFPGDDTALPHLLDQGLDMVGMLEQGGVELVVLYTLSPRIEDMTTMAQLTAMGFTSKATALILNEGLTSDVTLPPKPEFDSVLDHSIYRTAVERGAVSIWLPRLFAARAVEEATLLYGQVNGSEYIGPGNKSRVHGWLREMETAFAPVNSWLP